VPSPEFDSQCHPMRPVESDINKTNDNHLLSLEVVEVELEGSIRLLIFRIAAFFVLYPTFLSGFSFDVIFKASRMYFFWERFPRDKRVLSLNISFFQNTRLRIGASHSETGLTITLSNGPGYILPKEKDEI
jgi:hypothetical protein